MHLREVEQISHNAGRESINFVVIVSEHCSQIFLRIIDILGSAGLFVFHQFLLSQLDAVFLFDQRVIA